MIINFIHDATDTYLPEDITINFNYSCCDNLRYTFWRNNFVPINWYSNEALDFLYVAISVFAADRLISRRGAVDGWSRDVKLYIPVLAYEKWVENKPLLEDAVNFLSGDNWSFEFRPRSESATEQKFHNKWENNGVSHNSAKTYDRICMFSGGLDSFVGAIDLLEEKMANEKILFVSHYGGGKGTKEYQDYLIKMICPNYGVEKDDFRQFHVSVVDGTEDTTRTRSLMFFAHAIALASTFGKNLELTIPENGLISLNIPSTYSRIGTSSTRTTHPYYMQKLQQLLVSLGISVSLSNPYQFKTKGEMLVGCKGQEFLKLNLAHTMSCSHPDVERYTGRTHTMHCGYCLPCVIRKAAIKKAGIVDNSEYYDTQCIRGNKAIMNLNSYRQGLEEYNSKYAFMTIQQNGPITENIDMFADLYVRGMNELREYIEEI